MLSLMALAPLLVALKVGELNVFAGEELRKIGTRQAQGIKTIPALRGSIMDRNGRWLVVNTNRYELAVDPTAAGFSAMAQTFYARLAAVTGGSAQRYQRTVRRRSSPQYALLHRSISESQKEKIEAWEIPGILLTAQMTRHYNYGRLASHLLGHVDVDLRGLDGVEKRYDDYLRGADGRRYVQRDRRGIVRPMTGARVTDPEHGRHLKLTIDLVQQSMAEQELRSGVERTLARWGTVIAMEPETGRILALANYPDFDPNDAARYEAFARRNHAVTDRMEPGSTFKLVTAVAAMENGGLSMTDTFDTGPGVAEVSGRLMRDTHEHGVISLHDVIRVSSNIGAAKAGLTVEPADFYRTARKLGFGQNTWVDLPGEVPGKLKKPSTWSGLSQAWMSHGYEVEVTPLQLLTAYAALANGGLLVQPYVVEERHDVYGDIVWRARTDSIRRAFDLRTAQSLLPAFEAVVDSGTATRAGIEGLRIAGKTGTAKKAPYTHARYRATFVGFFPADDPQVAMIVVLDEPKTSGYGGVSAAPIFKRIAERWIATLPQVAARLEKPHRSPADSLRRLPDVRGLPATVATSRLRAEGYEVRDVSENDPFAVVSGHTPAPGSDLMVPVRLKTADPDVPPPDFMPNLVGLSNRQALAWLDARGIRTRLVGIGRVVHQTPPAGEPLPVSATLKCNRNR